MSEPSSTEAPKDQEPEAGVANSSASTDKPAEDASQSRSNPKTYWSKIRENIAEEGRIAQMVAYRATDSMQRAATRLESEVEHVIEEAELTHSELVNQQAITRKLPFWVRVIGVLFAFLAVVCTWETLDHAVVYLFPGSKQLAAYGGLLLISLVICYLSKKLTDREWVELGSFGFILGSLGAAASTWGLVEAVVRIYTQKSARLGIWAIGSVISLAASFVYMMLTHHNALLDIASCANSLGYFDRDDPESMPSLSLGSSSPADYKGCA